MRGVPRELRLALVGLSVALLLLGWAVASALNPKPVESVPPRISSDIGMSDPLPPAREAQISASVDVDPFSAERKRPAVRYKLAHELAEVPSGPPARQPLRWVGVLIDSDPDASFLSVAIGNNQNAPVEILKPGQKIGDYTLKSFTYKSATFQTSNGELIQIFNPTKGIR
jgi:hypothetical protein